MSHEEIEIEISRDGKVTVRTIGIKGAKCLEKAAEIVQIIGREESRELTSEYYESPQPVHHQTHIRRVP